MIGKVILSFGLLMIVACANPKRLVSQSGKSDAQEKAGSCMAHFNQSHDCLNLTWDKMPSGTDFGSFTFQISRANEADGSLVLTDVPRGTVDVVLWMPSMGHGAPAVDVERLAVGTYRAQNVFFTMKGEWLIRFEVKDQDVVLDQADYTIRL